MAIHEQHGIVIESYGPLTPTLRLKGNANPLQPTLEKIAKRLSESSGETLDENAVLLLWCKAKNVVAVTTTANEERVKGLAKLATLKEGLTKEEVKELDDIGKQYHFRFYVSSAIFLSHDLTHANYDEESVRTYVNRLPGS